MSVLPGWTPARIDWDDSEATVEWCYTEGVAFSDPFFDQTLARCRRNPFRSLFGHRTGTSALREAAASEDSLPLAGLIFHASRCGSTLVSQLLGLDPSVLVLAEPPPLDSVLRAGSRCRRVAGSADLDLLRCTVGALGRRQGPAQRGLVVKVDAWSILDQARLAAAFPGVPWVFVYRDPVEILVSHLGHRGYHMVPGTLAAESLLPGVDPRMMETEHYLARVLGTLLAAAVDAVRASAGSCLLVHHRQLPEAVTSVVAAWFGLTPSPLVRAAMAERAARDAKNPVLDYQRDGQDKQAHSTPALRRAVQQWVEPHYQALERLRLTVS